MGDQTLILEQAARFTGAISLMEVALRLPKGYLFSRWRSLLVMLGPVMVLMFVVSGLLAYAFLGISFWATILIGAIGIAALYYATLAEHTVGLEETWVMGSLVISAFVLAHGVTVAPPTRLYGRRNGAAKKAYVGFRSLYEGGRWFSGH